MDNIFLRVYKKIEHLKEAELVDIKSNKYHALEKALLEFREPFTINQKEDKKIELYIAGILAFSQDHLAVMASSNLEQTEAGIYYVKPQEIISIWQLQNYTTKKRYNETKEPKKKFIPIE